EVRMLIINARSLARPAALISLVLTIILPNLSCTGCSCNNSFVYDEIRMEPSSDIIVGEEVYFDATTLGGLHDPHLCSYEWNFGDDSMPSRTGRSVTHAFMRPGEYTVTVTAKYYGEKSASGRGTVTVGGEYLRLPPRPAPGPVLHYGFDDGLDDSSSSGLDAQCIGGGPVFCTGAQGGAFRAGGSVITCPVFGGELSGISGMTVSLWAKKSRADGEGCLVGCPGLFSLRVGVGGQQLVGAVTTDSGNAAAEPWYSGADDTNWHHYVLVYDGASVRIVFDGIDQNVDGHCPAPLTGALASAEGPLYIGAGNDSNDVFSGAIDEVKIYDRALALDEITTGFELRHADYHARYAQYLYVQVPGEMTVDPENTLVVTVGGDNGYEDELFRGDNLAAEERVLLDNSALPAGNYTVRAELRDGSGAILEALVERFSKPYDGAPDVGVDENNAIRIKGELVFPVTPFGLRNYEIDDWAAAGYVNMLHTQGFWGMNSAPVYTADGWEEYLDTGFANRFRAIGPGGGWAFYGEHYSNYLDRNADISIIEGYVNRLKDHEGMFAWNWRDEPELGGDDQYLPAEVVRAWTRRCHDLDPHHPTSVNLVGHWIGADYPSWAWSRSGNYLYMDNGGRFGRRTHVADILSMDYYPIEWAAPHSRSATMDFLIEIMDDFRERTGNLVPCMSAIETCDINEADGDVRQPTPWHPTPPQLKMLAWLTVVHGMKGIIWFPWHSGTPDENYPVMAAFVEQIGELAPVVLGPEIGPVVDVNASGERIETMARRYDGATWLFAVRVNESAIGGGPTGGTIAATITVEGVGNGTAYLFDEEGRTVPVTGGAIEDDFDPCEVHIYEIME
ncbi:MAG TPA: PKD domain-containing protein, partial [Spirochaetota bacterium]|nr:PKD domain-containing protein [Spirochaetota bacterium]